MAPTCSNERMLLHSHIQQMLYQIYRQFWRIYGWWNSHF